VIECHRSLEKRSNTVKHLEQKTVLWIRIRVILVTWIRITCHVTDMVWQHCSYLLCSFFPPVSSHQGLFASLLCTVQAIPLVNTELEMAHLFGLRDSALGEQLQIKGIQYTWKRSLDSIAEWQYSELQYRLAYTVWRNSRIAEQFYCGEARTTVMRSGSIVE
jgi:hypothetical protein